MLGEGVDLVPAALVVLGPTEGHGVGAPVGGLAIGVVHEAVARSFFGLQKKTVLCSHFSGKTA